MENWLQALQVRWLDRLQSRLVLPTARTLYLIGASLCVLAAAGGLLVALFFQLGTWRPASQKPLPELVSSQPGPIAYTRLDQRLSPPGDVRFVVDLAGLPAPLGDVALGHFEADTPNGLAAYPDDFQIVGGKDADLFEESQVFAPEPMTVLRAKAALIDEINKTAPTLKAATQRQFTVRVLTRDVFGNRSQPTDVVFTLTYGPSAPASQAKPIGEGQPASAVLKAIAVEIARIVDPTHGTPEYFEAYNTALAEPERCGAKGDDAFIGGYRQALDHARPRLDKNRLSPFYVGVCEAWKDAVKQGADAAAAAEASRLEVMMQNSEAQVRAAAARAASTAGRNAALVFAAGAVLAFMTIALFLAFLAIEGHSNAVRQAIEYLANQPRPGEEPKPPLEAARK